MTTLLPRSLLYTSVSAVSLFLLHPSSPLRAPPLQCQYYAPYPVPAQHARPEQSAWTFDPAAEKQGKTSPHRKNGNGGRLLTASTMRQISLGSVLGVLAGLGLRAVSRVLVFAVGVGIVVVEWAASRGYTLPLNRLQRYVRGVDLEGIVTRNVAFKTSFGATMALAAFARF
ncbi:hypothetical protein M432DRAFT_638192 [Thermoascus aurantiacus ATCC 26904]